MYGDVSQENINNLINNMNKSVLDIQLKGNDPSNWEEYKLDSDKSSYYCNNLCGVKKDCKHYQQYIEELKKQSEGYKKEDVDIFAELNML